MDLWDLREETVFRDLRLSLGRHPQTGQPCVLFMVQCGIGEYAARVQISEEDFRRFREDPGLTLPLTDRYQGLNREQVRALGAEC
ncbi:hypothetical protein DEIPH_ctg032orf0088 [Deinococcus phoenicis]|uniref:Uncharacterized protein n=1 Tax=Deinococcus phoenicis TaxID=1476583 RepID=A0A016QNV9_9DEIO|nr:hypothetical protein [Deinococcus phoenicis]EYB67840.1 hypothetical protein DEIPH_ctg032orf0088 [Deinococcus phoenicis]